jgi:2',3'-cyclic-nucleotide 2'-phosphodiesterase (5'-nucleotidase family)
VDLGSKGHPSAQAAADIVRSIAGADVAFIPAALLKEGTSNDLATWLQHTGDEIVVVSLRGSELTRALERSVANYPLSNSGFLQLSGLQVVFSASKAPESRVLELSVGGSQVDAGRQYSVAMPTSLAYGSLGYFKIWNRSQIVRKTGTTLDVALKGKTGAVRESRYTVR